jgi:hypothetical protein
VENAKLQTKVQNELSEHRVQDAANAAGRAEFSCS